MDDLTPYFERPVIIDEQATVKLFLLNYIQIHIYKLELSSNIFLELYQKEDIIYKFSIISPCTGISPKNHIDNYTCDQFYHSKCVHVILPLSSNNSINNLTSTAKYKFCTSSSKLISQKRNGALATRKIKHIHVNITPIKGQKLKLLT